MSHKFHQPATFELLKNSRHVILSLTMMILLLTSLCEREKRYKNSIKKYYDVNKFIVYQHFMKKSTASVATKHVIDVE